MFHSILKEKFGFPEYYGKNWDVLWDCLDGLFDEPIIVEIYGLESLPKDLRESSVKMLEVFDDVHTNSPHVAFCLIF
ncbi:MAG: barstar family protein [Christensenellales bacterium]